MAVLNVISLGTVRDRETPGISWEEKRSSFCGSHAPHTSEYIATEHPSISRSEKLKRPPGPKRKSKFFPELSQDHRKWTVVIFLPVQCVVH